MSGPNNRADDAAPAEQVEQPVRSRDATGAVPGDIMSPDSSPTGLRSGVRRLNNLPLYILGGVVLAFLAMMAIVAADRAAQQGMTDEEKAKTAGNASMFAREIAGDKVAGLVEAAKPPKVPDLPPMPIAKPGDQDLPPPPPPRGDADAPVQTGAPDEEAIQFRQSKQQLFAEAVKARTAVRVEPTRSGGAGASGAAVTSGSPSREDMIARIAAVRQQAAAQPAGGDIASRMAQTRAVAAEFSGAGSGGSPGAGGTASRAGPSRNSYERFAAASGSDRWRLDSSAEAPRTAYELRAGSVLPAVLISGINSDLPGQIAAQVSQDVFDTATGRWTLIPQGSKLVGQYSSEVAYGQSRVLVAWQRIVMPDGKALDIGSMPGADGAGMAGFNDQVNNHYLRIFGSALLMSAITAGVTISQNCEEKSGGSSSTKCTLSEALGQQLGGATAALIQKNLNIAPTLEIRPGYRFHVFANKDITFSKPYKAFDY